MADRAQWLEVAALAPWLECVAERGRMPLHSAPHPARAFLVGAALARLNRPLLIVCERFKESERIAAELEIWVGPERVELFPSIELAGRDAQPDPRLVADRLRVLQRLSANGLDAGALAVVTTEAALMQEVMPPESFEKSRWRVRVGDMLDPDALMERLETAGYARVARVDEPGQVARRGGIVDVFSRHADLPVRMEFFGDEVESLREFAVEDQLKRGDVTECELVLAAGEEADGRTTLRSYLRGDWIEAHCVGDPAELPLPPTLFEHDFLRGTSSDLLLHEQRQDVLRSHLRDWGRMGWRTVVFCHNEGEEQRLREILESDAAGLSFEQAPLTQGFIYPEAKVAVLTDAEIFGRYQHLRVVRHRERLEARRRAQATDFSDINPGDYVVHVSHGIAKFQGVQRVGLGGDEQEVLVLEFEDEAKLYVPLPQAHLVSRYVGVGKKRPKLDTLGGGRWEKAKIAANRAILDYAAGLLQLDAERKTRPGHPFPPDSQWQREFEASFMYRETEDQLRAIEDAKGDMESARPMDRLICGDVGFGKTEVAVRAAFKAVMAGRQVAFLCPTTVLAQQHFQTLRERMADYPVRIEVLSRFVSGAKTREVVRDVAEGGVDIVVGTHRLLSSDLVFKRLGLLIVDEEQRFGVRHKEKLKERFRQIDCLTLSATPIPRTLYLALMGARDMSTIDTPPPGRLAVETALVPYDERIIREAIERELKRDGQIYFLHNRVATIDKVAARIKELVPGVRVLVGHGQMDDEELEQVMMTFVAGEADVLVSTTIIESGLDIPNANTIIIDRADRFGLADLYQLRGRVGRGQHKAYAYLMLPRDLLTTAEARKRTAAIEQYSQLGAGLKIAMRDLEIRGAGNLLGTQQSGHIVAIGFELYCQLLKQAVEQLRKGAVTFRRETPVRIEFVALHESQMEPGQLGAFIPSRFLRDAKERIAAYRELHEAGSPEEVDAVGARWRDRFGRLPEEMDALLAYARLKAFCGKAGAHSIEVTGDQVRVKKGNDFVMIGTKFPRLSEAEPRERFEELVYWVERLLGTGN